MQGKGSAAVQLLPPLPWLGLLIAGALLGLHAGGPGLGLLVGAALGYLAVFGQWQSAMVTLSSIAIAVPLGVLGGVLLGIAAYRHSGFERALAPVLDAMQTIPVFAYLLPILILFGFGPVAALIATIIYAMPPMVRVTLLALRGVPEEIVEYGRMSGATPRQLIWRVMVPSARAPLMVGVNQVIMLSLNMVIIASMIGAGGLGYDVLTSLRRLDIGAGLEAGVAIVVLAVALDRLSQAYAVRAGQGRPGGSRLPLLALAAVLAVWMSGFLIPAVAIYPEDWQISTSDFWAELIRWLNVTYFDTFEAIKTAILLNFLVPVRRFLVAIPWWWGTGVVAFAMWRIGGPRRAVIAAAFCLFIAFTGYWEPAMVTVYLVSVSVAIAVAIGIPVGIVAALNPSLWRVVQAVIDTLQTLPSFVYLIPVVMLFRVGEFTAMIAIVLYAIVPAIRYTALGIREVNPSLIEAATAMGTTKFAADRPGPVAAGVAGDPAGGEPDDPAGDLDAGHHGTGGNARSRAGGLYRSDQGRCRPRAGHRRLHRDDSDDRGPDDVPGRATGAPAVGDGDVSTVDDAIRLAAGLGIWSGPVEPQPLGRRDHQSQLHRLGRRATLRGSGGG